MKVKELIEKLKELDQELTVYVWDAYDDRETQEVYVNVEDDGIHIVNFEFDL